MAELTDLIGLDRWPQGTRLIVRREPLHPGTQTSLFPHLEFRYWSHYTDAEGDPVDLDLHMRAHARVEDHIRRLKALGRERLRFSHLEANRAWLAVVWFAADLVCSFQLLCIAGRLATAELKTLRWELWHSPARVVRCSRRRIVRVLDTWPTTCHLLGAYQRFTRIT